MPQAQDITKLLEAYAEGDRAALDRMFPMVYEELNRIAHGRLLGERADHTLNTGALVHEAYIKLARLDQIDWKNRSHFFAIASTAMRHILVDYALAHKAQKRGGHQHRVPLENLSLMADQQAEDVLELHEALEKLETLDERQAQIVTYRFFGGLNIDETAEALSISPATVSRDWTMARAWLHRELSRSASAQPQDANRHDA
jgi:RNA polymerase sigma factor (TIGR02999 family)